MVPLLAAQQPMTSQVQLTAWQQVKTGLSFVEALLEVVVSPQKWWEGLTGGE